MKVFKKLINWYHSYLFNRKKSPQFEADVILSDNDECISAIYPNGETQKLNWVDLIRIELHTNDSGPWGADVWWILKGNKSECIFPQRATGENEVFEKMKNLEGFNNDELIKAMACTINNVFLCWELESKNGN